MDNSNIIISIIIVLCIAAGVTAYGISEGDNAVFNDLTGFTPSGSSSGTNGIGDLIGNDSNQGTGSTGASTAPNSGGSSGGSSSGGSGTGTGSGSNSGSSSGTSCAYTSFGSTPNIDGFSSSIASIASFTIVAFVASSGASLI